MLRNVMTQYVSSLRSMYQNLPKSTKKYQKVPTSKTHRKCPTLSSIFPLLDFSLFVLPFVSLLI